MAKTRLCLLLLLSLCLVERRAHAQMLLENSMETRFQIDLKVPQAALQAYFPVGFTSNVATQGPAKDCNLRAVFIDRLSVHDPEGKVAGRGSNRLVQLVAPVKDPSGNPVQLVISGLTADDDDAPGYYGNYLLATTHDMRRATTVTGSRACDGNARLGVCGKIRGTAGVAHQVRARAGHALPGK